MPNCNCAGSTCSCSVTAGSGVQVKGTGTAANPFVISVDLSTFKLGSALQTQSTATVEMSSVGTGASGDPLIVAADVVLRSPSGIRYTLAVTDAGVLSATTASPSRPGTGSSTGTTVLNNDILYWDGTQWDTRSTTLTHAIFNSIGYTGVPIPPTFKKGDTWLCEAT